MTVDDVCDLGERKKEGEEGRGREEGKGEQDGRQKEGTEGDMGWHKSN